MNYDTRAGQQRLVRRVVDRNHAVRQRRRTVTIGTDQQHRSLAQTPRRFNTLAKEITRNPNRRRSEREDDRRWTGIQKLREFGGHGRLMATVVKTEARDFRWLR